MLELFFQNDLPAFRNALGVKPTRFLSALLLRFDCTKLLELKLSFPGCSLHLSDLTCSLPFHFLLPFTLTPLNWTVWRHSPFTQRQEKQQQKL